MRDCDADLVTKNKHSLKNLNEYKPKKTKHPKLGNYTVTSTKPKPVKKTKQLSLF